MPAFLGSACLAAAIIGGGSGGARAQSQWDSTVSNSHWYVPSQQLLAYMSPSTSFATPLPIGDQTLWALGTSTNGVFAGTSNATLQIGPALATQLASIQGTVLPSGQISMIFTPTGGGATTVGMGYMRVVDGVTSMEMQMITGDSVLVTHWAYMMPYDPASFSPPAPRTVPVTQSSQQWSWTEGTPWRVASPAMFGSAAPGKMIISNYVNGYFWGRGVAPSGGGFTLLGSITPEGKVLFASTDGRQLTTQYGGISGDAAAAQIQLQAYNPATGVFAGTGSNITLVSPYALTTTANYNLSALGAAKSLYRIAGTELGLVGDMSGPIDTLNSLSGPALSGAISQTLPVLAGQGAQATYATQRAYQRTVDDRISDVFMGDASPNGRNAWMAPYSSSVRQGQQNGYQGYSGAGGGVAAGLDGMVSERVMLGINAGYGYSGMRGKADYTDATLDVGSIHAGLYGSYLLGDRASLFFNLDGAFNANSSSRTMGFFGTNANASFGGTTMRLGVGGRAVLMAEGPWKVAATARADYGLSGANGYSETGAGPMGLNVGSQSWNELRLGGELNASYALTPFLRLTGSTGVSYDVQQQVPQVTAGFQGGGPRFPTQGPPDLSPVLYSFGVGLIGFRQEALELGLRYRLEASPSDFLGQSASLQLKMKL